MSIFDIVLLVIIGAFAVNGLMRGIIRLVGNIVGLFVGAYVASHYYLALYGWFLNFELFSPWISSHSGTAKIIAFLTLLFIGKFLVAVVFFTLEKVFNFVAIIPGSRYINNLLGAVMGLFEGAVLVGLVIYVISRYAITSQFFGTQLAASVVAPHLVPLVTYVLPFLPDTLKALQSIVK